MLEDEDNYISESEASITEESEDELLGSLSERNYRFSDIEDDYGEEEDEDEEHDENMLSMSDSEMMD